MKQRILDDAFISRLESVSLYFREAMKGFFGGNHKAPTYGSTVEFADFREYVPGDDIRRIDWNLYSRFEKHFIRLFVDERQMHTRIYLDCSASMGQPSKAMCSLQAAAALGYLSVQSMDRLSIHLIHGDTSDDLCGTITGKESFYGSLAKLEATQFKGTAHISKAITSSVNPGYDDGLTVIISDFLTEYNWKKAVDFLRYRHREVMLIQVMSPEELDPAYNGRMKLIDTESDDIEDSRNMKMRINKNSYLAYLEALKDYQADMCAFAASRSAAYVVLNAGKPVENELFTRLFESEVIR